MGRRYVDQQTLKLQEAPEAVPTGEMPRSTLVVVERGLVDRASPGARVSMLGMLSLFERSDTSHNPDAAVAAIRVPYLKVVGVEFDTNHKNVSYSKIARQRSTVYLTILSKHFRHCTILFFALSLGLSSTSKN